MLAPFGRLIVSLKLAVLFITVSHPFAPPFCAVHAQDHNVICAGMVSVTVAPMTSLGPLFVTVIVYVNMLPAT